MTPIMPPDTEQGILVELNYLLAADWNLTLEAGIFRVSPPLGSHATPEFARMLTDEAWRIARFVAYSFFASITKRPEGSYHIVSCSEDGIGFQIVLEATSNNLPNHRLKPFDDDDTDAADPP